MSKRTQLTVGQLIALLEKEDRDQQVVVEGCDCDRGAVAVRRYNRDGVYIESADWVELHG